MSVRLTLRTPLSIPIELDGVLPETIAGRSNDEIAALPILVGNRFDPLGELFEVAGKASDETLELFGDLAGVHGIARRMTRGLIHVQGAVGRHAGAQMSGGELVVDGNAGDWLGAEMAGGGIRVQGDAGHLVGSPYRGSIRGMTGGTIVVQGSAGHEVGRAMRRGMLAVGGDVGDAAGFGMLAGTLVVVGRLGIRAGANMRRGTILQLAPERPALLPTFRHACRTRPSFWRLLVNELQRLGLNFAPHAADHEFELYRGDFLAGGRGEVFFACS